MSGSKSSFSSREQKMRHALFRLFSQAENFLSLPFFLCSVLFLASDVVDLHAANLICRLIFSHHSVAHPFKCQT